ncbi:endonuclease domain-containing protein [Sphingomonas aerolata]|uniref:endonuclease domain-containing protein n=1 Tax=Sphingomonas aerolata TaxID=185951 RepID=UPI001DB101F2|nr:very-short-patch-repair endonuclease [Sphingomonas aerolata]
MAKVDGVLLDRARRMRREPTPAEAMLWRYLRGRQISGVKFIRQFVIGPYIADFAARDAKLVIEVDGDTHSDQARDESRTDWLERQGYRVIRFSNADIMSGMDGVWLVISAAIERETAQ